MALFKIPIAATEYPVLTAEMAQAIYVKFKAGKDHTTQFTENGTYMYHSTLVWNEILKLESEITNYINTDVEPSSEAELIATISSDILDTETLVDDMIIYNPIYNVDRTFSEFMTENKVENIV